MQTYKMDPKEALEFLVSFNKETEDFKYKVNSLAEFDSTNAVYPNILKNLGRFDVHDVVSDFSSFPSPFARGEDFGVLVEHVRTGQVYAIIPDYAVLTVYGYEQTTMGPKKIRTDLNDAWIPTAVDSLQTRYGGVTDFNVESWPHFQGSPLKFMAQYKLPDNRMIHVFCNIDETGSWRTERGPNCAIVDGSPVPSWIEMKSIVEEEEAFDVNPEYYDFYMFNANKAFKPENVSPTPRWVQEEDIPEGYGFLLQFGYSTVSPKLTANPDLRELSLGDCGDMYLFYKEDTQESRVTWQCS
ncbi:MAG TPA: hypothetical protein VLR52_02210 [Bacteroidales bacterium]|nr:hypothetical protein [Bacteroidales bacterium]